ncbi:MAG: serine--tRNA ligase [Saprospiraceae bacterium]|nr:serine--tRNA ligase [Saprospiraceae bacterium]MBK7810115.1 serine--tRNA ligase [Saprospiraceae bacterium]MBK9629720.1 serine--tRNA ligase [Saprospiraceae bacterium]
MLELRLLRQEKARIIKGLHKRAGYENIEKLIDEIIETDDERKTAQSQNDLILSQINSISKEVGEFMKSGKKSEAESLKLKVAELKNENKQFDDRLRLAQEKLESILIQLPNVPHESVPNGKTPEDNEIYKAWSGELPVLGPEALPHWELAKKYKVFDMELGVKISGSGFILYRQNGARLQRALINFFLDEAGAAGYEEIQAPLLVNGDSARGTGQLPDKEGQMYYVEKDDLYLIPTAEVPVTNIYRDVILKEMELPIKLTGYTPCFRREAGSYGAHVKGLNRVHQFDKIEIVRIEHPDNSYTALMDMLTHVEGLLQKLELPYRILRLCGGDMGFASALTFDFEVWSAAQQRWLEVSSVSNFETFQTNRMKLRIKTDSGEIKLAHTLNGSALALARIVASILENHQTENGIRLPKALVPYFGKEILA